MNIFKSIQKRYQYNREIQSAAFLLLLYILIASTAEAIFTDVTGCFTFAVIATYLGNNIIDSDSQECTTASIE